MHVDARNLENNSLIEGDICIVGAGAAGISMALEFMNLPYKIILLESGGFEYEDRIQELYRGKTTGQPYYPIKSTELHYFGGTTGHWGGMCSFFDPIAFEKRHWVPDSGWPFGQDSLMPYYERGYKYLEIGVFEFGLEYWQKKDSSLVTLPLDKDVFWTKLWNFSKPTRFGTRYKDTIVNAKNIHLYTYANLVDIVANESVKHIESVTVSNFAGKTHRVKAKYFVLACAGIQNPRILLAANKQAPLGLGNDHDLVGRYFMEHFEIKSAELWMEQKSELKLYMNLNPRVHGELAVVPKKQEEYEILNGLVSFTPLEIAKTRPSYIQVWTKSDPRENMKVEPEPAYKTFYHNIKKLFVSESSKNLHQAFQLTLRMEQTPNPLSRVTLGTEKDELGVPRASLNWAFTPLDRKSIRKIYEMVGQQAGAAGIGRLKLMEELWDENGDKLPTTTSGGWHHMGTTRMNEDPKKGVVDANCKLHGIDNLFLAGSSTFPTGGGVNPTYTIVAMSIRLVDHLSEQMKA
jgi:choline dehydrogenase-like flavoprotein